MAERLKIVIVGGGFTGAAAAIHLSRMANRSLDIRLIEGRKDASRGVAYETEDPAHRLNVPPKIMILYPDDIGHFERYVDARRISKSDPEAVAADGSIYPRREVFGDYMVAELAARARENPSRSEISHLRDRALSVTRANGGFRIGTEAGDVIDGDAVLTCLSHGQPSGLPGLSPELRDDPRLIGDPWEGNALAGIGVNDRVLIAGTGLTAADVQMSLHLRGHRGSLVMLSRHGLPPNRQPDFGDIQALLSRLARAQPIFIERHG